MDTLLSAKTIADELADPVTFAEETDERARIIYANPAFFEITGYSSAEVIGRSHAFLEGPRTDGDALARMRADRSRAGRSRGTVINYTKDGREILFDLRARRLDANGTQPRHWIFVRREIRPTDLVPRLRVLFLGVEPLLRAGLQRCLAAIVDDLTVRQAVLDDSVVMDANADLAIMQALGQADQVVEQIGKASQLFWTQQIALIADDQFVQSAVPSALPANVIAIISEAKEERLLAHTLRLVIEGGRYFEPAPPASQPADQQTDWTAVLTRRQHEILHLLRQGLSNEEIARMLGVSPHTVKGHMTRLFKTLGVRSRAQAVARYVG